MKNKLTTLFLFVTLTSFASNPTSIEKTLAWDSDPYPINYADGSVKYEVWRFDGAFYNPEHPSLPIFYQRFEVEGNSKFSVSLLEATWESIPLKAGEIDAVINNTLSFDTYISKDRGKAVGNLMFIPIRRIPGGYEKLVSFKLEITHQTVADNAAAKGGGFANSSVLKDGDIYKIAVTTNGIHKIDYDFLVNELGISSSVDPRNIQLYGNSGGLVPEDNGADRQDDLVENAIFFSGQADGQLNTGDFILFYAEGPHQWIFDEATGFFDFQMNVYDSRNYYFIKVGNTTGRRVQSQASVAGSYTSTIYNDYRRQEDDLVNLLNDFPSGQGSGRQWFGDQFKILRSYSYPDLFNFPYTRTDEEANVKARIVARTGVGGTSAKVTIGNNTFTSASFTATDLSDQDDPYATSRTIDENFFPNGSTLSVSAEYPQTATETLGWVDYIQLNVRRDLRMQGDQITFRDIKTLAHPSATFQLSEASGALTIWDITDAQIPVNQEYSQNGSTVSFGTSTTSLKEFVAFRPTGEFFAPTAVGKITNQNLHGLADVDFVIVYHPDLYGPAKRLADHRAANSNFQVELVEVGTIFNEFSSGRQDAAAIRDFARMLYSRDQGFRYLLFFGDGSYDHRNINGLGNNMIMTYETEESIDPIYAYPTDDFFGLLDENEGGTLSGDLDIAIGRFPVRNVEEANVVVDKVIHYDTSPDALGDWRNRMVFAGDDEDGGTHTRDADNISKEVVETSPQLNLDKIYVDAFNQISTPGGQRVPSATESLNQNMFKGILAITYLGHGGPKGWAQERILQIPDINSWTNYSKLPIFITATCTFAGYDDPSFTSSGERTILNDRGGAIALFTTVRPVLSTSNAILTSRVTDTLFDKSAGEAQRLGEVLRLAKNLASITGAGVNNSRKFTLLGDPSMQISLPRYNVATTQINGIDVTQAQPDTIRALEKITIAGEIQDNNGQLLENFNGILYPTVFDKAIKLNTLGQDGTPVREYELQKSVLFKGRASVINGKFSFTFVVPKDINYEFGYGKISYYAEDGQSMDASGYYSDLTIGGTNPNGLADNQGPKVEVYMDSEEFVFGGITNEDPILLVILEDDNGINVVGNSIGHDLTGLLDEDTQNSYLLNDFYEAELDDYTKGKVRYPLSALAEGRHAIEVKAFDVANNSETGYTEFVVANSGKVALEHVLNYPNPFVNSTCFQFEHNMSGQELDVMIQIYTVSGRVVKTIQERISPTDSRLSLDDCIKWDGRDDFGDELARGVYIYKVKVRAADTGAILLEGESDFEKLVILK
ncbi:MAG: type IX secretion system sortase PorU [Saprospiraceae bacterium]|nr:type IX secretion system sortase PorU [Saprospiraceae bacterium]